MPTPGITVACGCGKTYRVDANKMRAGASFTCRTCGRKISSPAASSIEFESATATDVNANKSRGHWQWKALALLALLGLGAATTICVYSIPGASDSVKALFQRKEKPAEELAGAQQADKKPSLKIGFDLNDMDKTNKWAIDFRTSLKSLEGKEGSGAKITKRVDAIEPDFVALRGQTVQWDLYVESISDSEVVLLNHAHCVTFSDAVSPNRGEVVLKVGKTILPEDVAKLRAGNTGKITVRGTIEVVTLNPNKDYMVYASVKNVATPAAHAANSGGNLR